MIEVKNLTKKYGNHIAVSDLNFKIGGHKIYGLLGPNGAGKSTTMNMMTGCLSATEGTVKINGFDIYKDPVRAKRMIGYLPEIPPLYTDMTPDEYLVFVARAKGVPYDQLFRQVAEVIDLTGLGAMKKRLIRSLSKGYKQRVGLAMAMLGNPDIIILDEPTVGLDPRQLIEVRDLIRDLGKSRTVIISSHILSEISEVCEHVLILSEGRLVANDTLESLQSHSLGRKVICLSVKGEEAAIREVLEAEDAVTEYSYDESKAPAAGVIHFKATVRPDTDPRDRIVLALASRSCPVVSISMEENSLENVFLDLTSRRDETPAEPILPDEEVTE